MSPAPEPTPSRAASLGLAAWIALGVCSGVGMALAAWLLIAPDVGPPAAIPFQDKIFHFVAFGCLTGPGVLALGRSALPFWLAHMLAFAAGVEVVQGLTHLGRSASVVDFLAGALGIAAATGLALMIRGVFTRKASAATA